MNTITLETLLKKLEEIESKIDLLLPTTKTPDDVEKIYGYRTHQIDKVACFISRSGNVSWRAYDLDNNIIYLRQAHKELLEAAGLWQTLNIMVEGDERKADIEIGTIPDGDFRKLVKISDGAFIDDGSLRSLVERGQYIILDTETTDLYGMVCQLAIVDSAGVMKLNKLIKPPVPISSEATAVHGISNEMVANAATLSEIADELDYHLLSVDKVIGWNISFDRDALLRTARACDLPQLIKTIESVQWFDAMTPFSEIYGEWSEYHGNYKWQKLTTAAQYYNISTNGAHNALADAKKMSKPTS